MKKLTSVLLGFGFIFVSTASSAQESLPLDGGCPPKWRASSGYCVKSSSSSPDAIGKVPRSSCPDGWFAYQNYCVKSSPSSPEAIVKHGSCPSGWRSYGKYCQK